MDASAFHSNDWFTRMDVGIRFINYHDKFVWAVNSIFNSITVKGKQSDLNTQ